MTTLLQSVAYSCAWVQSMKYTMLVCLLFLHAASSDASEFETSPTLNLSDLIPARLISGPNHNVLPDVSSNGFQNSFIIESDYGQFMATGVFGLRIRIREVDALAYLKTMSKTEVFVDSLVDAGIDTAKSFTRMFTDPVGTVKGIPGGVTRLFSGYVDSTKRGVNYAQNIGKDFKDAEVDPKEFKKRNYLLSDTERQWAAELKTDPYTTNLKLRAVIGEMSVVQFVGGLPVSYALPVTLSVTADVLGELAEKIYMQNASELEVSNRVCLSDAGISPETIEEFFASDYMTPTMHSVFCASISRLKGVKNLELVAVQLPRTHSFRETRFLLNTVSLLAWYQKQYKNIDRISSRTTLPYGVTNNNELVAIVPADYLIWSESLAANVELLNSDERPFAEKSIWLVGQTSEKARREFAKRGWTIHDRDNDEQMAKLFNFGLEEQE